MILTNRFFLFVTAITLSLCTACSILDEIDEIETAKWQPQISAAILTAELESSNLFSKISESGTLIEDVNGDLSFQYGSDLFSQEASVLVEIPDVVGPMLQPEVAFPFPEPEITVFTLGSGRLTYEFQSPYPGDIEMTIGISNALKEEEPFEETFVFTSPGTITGSFDLSNYSLVLTDGTVNLRYEAKQVDTEAPLTFPVVLLGFEGLNYAYLEGALEKTTIASSSDSVSIDLFQDWNQGSFTLSEADLSIVVENSIGFPVNLIFNEFEAETKQKGMMEVNSSSIDNGFSLNYPAIGEIGQVRTSEFSLNSTNSNIAEVLSGLPEKFMVSMDAILNEEESSEPGFSLPDDKIDVGLSINIPLYGTFEGIVLKDTLDLDLDNLDQISSGKLRLVSQNGFPLDLAAQLYLLDENRTIMDSLFVDNKLLLKAASVDVNGVVDEPMDHSVDLYLGESKLRNLQAANQVLVQFVLNSTDAGETPVRLRSTYKLGLQLGLQADVSPNTD